jgi:peptide deformylase
LARLEVLKFPDPRLRRKAEPVAEVTPELARLADDMLETMYDSKGIGLASTQVGEIVSLLVIDTRPRDVDGRYDLEELTEMEKAVPQPIQIFNPEIVAKEGDTVFSEGCLSVPGYYEEVKRAELVEVKGLDKNGKEMRIKTDGLLAICLQHEMDHLDGKLFIDRLSPLKSNRIKSKIKKHGYDLPTKSSDRETEEVL